MWRPLKTAAHLPILILDIIYRVSALQMFESVRKTRISLYSKPSAALIGFCSSPPLPLYVINYSYITIYQPLYLKAHKDVALDSNNVRKKRTVKNM